MMSQERVNPFSEIYKVCNEGNSKEKFANLADFPKYIDIELTNTCNFRCLMCPTGNMTQSRKLGFMAEGTFWKILEELKEHKTPLRFIRWGEPTMHPKLAEFIRAASEAGVMTHINTNGSFLDEEKISELIDAGLSSIKFSFQGVDQKSYAEMRSTDFYNELVAIIKLFRDIRGDRMNPYIHASTSITYETREMVQKFREELDPITDLTTVGRTYLDRVDAENFKLNEEKTKTIKWLKSQESVVKEHPECPEVFDKMSINWDGTVSACCADYDKLMTVGEFGSHSLQEIWHSKVLNRYRKVLADMGHDKLPLCKDCWDFQGLQTPGLQNTD